MRRKGETCWLPCIRNCGIGLGCRAVWLFFFGQKGLFEGGEVLNQLFLSHGASSVFTSSGVGFEKPQGARRYTEEQIAAAISATEG
jgi:hypothetical protein